MFCTIKGFEDYEISKIGVIRKKSNKYIKSQYLNDRGYYMVTLTKNKKQYPVRVHRILAKCFIDRVYGKNIINHKDGDKLNNNIENLEWCTQAENMKHAIDMGLTNNVGENNGMAKLNQEKVNEIKQLLKNGNTQQSIADNYSVSRACIQKIKEGRTWA